MRALILISLLLVTSCNTKEDLGGTETGSYPIIRFENEEVTCYYHYDGGITCKWKGQ